MFNKYNIIFINKPIYIDAEDNINFKLAKKVTVKIISPSCFLEVNIPEGFKTDFATVPFLFRGIFPKAYGRYRRAALLHDYLCRYNVIDRDEADKIFYVAMRQDNVPFWKRFCMYLAVALYTQFLKIIKR